jgi:hypothetical protein
MSGCRIVTFAALDLSITIPNGHTLVKIHFAVWQNRLPRDVFVANDKLTMETILSELNKVDTNDAAALRKATSEGALYVDSVNDAAALVPPDDLSVRLDQRFPDRVGDLQGSTLAENETFKTRQCKAFSLFVGKVLEDLPTGPPNVPVPSPEAPIPSPIVPAPSPIVPSPAVPAPIVPAPGPSSSLVSFSLDNTSLLLIGGFLLVCCCVIVALLVMPRY